MLPDLSTLSARLGVAEPKALLQASDIFLLASVGEAFGLVLAEAMACGVPIVGSRSGSLTEVVEEKETGCDRTWDIGLSSVFGRTSRSTVLPRARSGCMRYCEASRKRGWLRRLARG